MRYISYDTKPCGLIYRMITARTLIIFRKEEWKKKGGNGHFEINDSLKRIYTSATGFTTSAKP